MDENSYLNSYLDRIETLARDNGRLEERLMETGRKLDERTTSAATADVIRTLLCDFRGGQAIQCIKAIRALTGLGLKEAKDLYEFSKGAAL